MLVKMTIYISAKCLMFFLCVITVTATSIADVKPKRYELIHSLLNETGYDHSLPPGVYTESATNVSVEIIITDLNYESDIKMEYECTLYLHLNWTDERLNFSSRNTPYDSLKLSQDLVDKIWIPDLFFYHERESVQDGLFTKNQLAYIFREGSVVYSGRFKIKLNCHLDLTKYPYERQRCPIVIQSYAFTKDEILLHWNGKDAVKIEDTPNMNVTEKSLHHTYSADSVGNFSILKANITFKRPQESFLVMYVVPPIILVTISFTSFLLGDNVESRIIVPTGVLTQLIMQWAGIYNKLPPVSVLIQLDRWMLTNLVFVGLVLIVNAVICHFVILKDKEAKKKAERKNENKNIELKLKGLKQNDNTLEDNCKGMPTNSHTLQQQQPQQAVEIHMDEFDERRGLIRQKHLPYGSTEREDEENSDGRSIQNKGYNKGGPERLPQNNEINELQDNISQAVDNKPGCLEKLKRRLCKEKNNKEKKTEMKERKLVGKEKTQKENKGMTKQTQLEDEPPLMKGDPRFEREKNRNMESKWYQTFIDKIRRNMNVTGFLLIAITYIIFLLCFLKTWLQ